MPTLCSLLMHLPFTCLLRSQSLSIRISFNAVQTRPAPFHLIWLPRHKAVQNNFVCIRLERKEGIPSFCFSGSNTKKGSLRFVHSASIGAHKSEFPSMHRPHNSHKSKIYWAWQMIKRKEGIPPSRLLNIYRNLSEPMFSSLHFVHCNGGIVSIVQPHQTLP